MADDRLRTALDVLLIEHEPADEIALSSAIAAAGLPYRITVARDVAQAWATLAVRRFDLIFVSYELGDGTALDLVSAFAGQPVILTAAADDDNVTEHALQLNATDFLVKDRQRDYLKVLALRVAATLRTFEMTQRLLECEGRYHALLECSPESVCIHRSDTLLYVNPAALALLGATSTERLIGCPLSALVHPNARPWPTHGTEGVELGHSETVLLNQKGETVRVLATSTRTVYDGKPAIHTAMRDANAQARTEAEKRVREAELRESELRYRNLVETTQDLITRVDYAGRLTFVNRAAETIFGLSCSECIGLSAFDFVHEDDRAATQEAFGQWLKQNAPRLTFENRQVSRSGDVFVMHWSITADRSEAGELIGFSGIARDVTQVREQQRLLADSQAIAHIGSWKIDLATLTSTWTDETFRIFGLSPGAGVAPPLDRFVEEHVDPDDQQSLRDWVAACSSGARPPALKFRSRPIDGVSRWVLGYGALETKANGEPLCLVGTVQDITSLRQTEIQLRLSEQRLRTIIETEPECVKVVGPAGDLIEMNPAGLAMLEADNLEQVRTHSLVEFISPDYRAAFVALHRRVMAGETGTLEFQVVGLHGTQRWLETHAAPVRDPESHVTMLLGITRDVTARKRSADEKSKLEAQLQQAQKMEAVGRLAGGVAHDFNNMLGVILGHAELAMTELGPTQPMYENVAEIYRAAERSAALTGQLLAFARRQTITPTVLDLNESVASSLKMLQRLIRENIKVTWRPAEELWMVKLDPSQMSQILTNLCVNACDAIADAGVISIETANRVLDSAFCASHAEAVPGDYVELTVRDSGAGMDKATQAQIFEPFFTTKAAGKGTGLGLATVYGAVKQNHGFITVRSDQATGTTFALYIPRLLANREPIPPTRTKGAAPRGAETILLVEDEPANLTLTARLLEAQGYTVLKATSGREAMLLAFEHAGHIDLLATDVIMPDLNGRELATRLRSRFPALKCLFMSGYPADVITQHGVLDDAMFFIPKPFSIHDLAAKVRNALNAAAR